jgi:hypothetical protein
MGVTAESHGVLFSTSLKPQRIGLAVGGGVRQRAQIPWVARAAQSASAPGSALHRTQACAQILATVLISDARRACGSPVRLTVRQP